ncbi:hypothetical protein D7231_34080 [Streptomyces klenkii]|uniref:Tyr recombinase domain-containing protein n=1 Tax=Streptomyces klenkii TaxID=1420899 RepID=A0A3B0AG06_9ACTN|nr:hypothetical protein [Streptomyces klenkii]RKN59675.1 hypothetical protein D7231_34080 [Streptomyces klenkii]
MDVILGGGLITTPAQNAIEGEVQAAPVAADVSAAVLAGMPRNAGVIFHEAADAIIYVDQSLLTVLWWQYERQQYEKERLGDLWVDHDLVFARDGFKLQPGGMAGGPQDPEKVSARWRTVRNRLHLPELFRLHDLRASKINNDLDAKENPVEVSANARHHSVGYTLSRYGRRRPDSAKKLAASSAGRIGLAGAASLTAPALASSL